MVHLAVARSMFISDTHQVGASGQNTGHQILRALGWAEDDGRQASGKRELGDASGFTLLELDGQLLGSEMQYRVNVNDPRVGRDTITIAYRAPVLGWLAIGFSDSGQMVGSEAVIGLPETSQVWKYSLQGKSGVGEIVAMSEQTLMDYAVLQDEAAFTTTLIFTKIMDEDGEKQIVPGINNFLGAYGSSNTLGIHSNRQAFEIDLWTDVTEDTDTGTGGYGGDQVTDEPTSPPTAESTQNNGPAAVGQEGFTVVALEGGQLQGSTLLFKVNPSDPNAGGVDTVTFEYTVPQLGWVAIGFTDNGGFMVGSEAVIGLPDTGEVLKFELGGKTTPQVTPMPEAKQTLIGASIVQDATSTTLTFTKRMVEDGEVPIEVGPNTFLAAYSGSNSLGIHSNRDSFALDLASGGVANIQVRKQALWRAHGLFALIAWGFLLPCAIAASILRAYFKGGLWFKIHRGLNTLVVLFTLIAFTLAVVAIHQETPAGACDHFNPNPNIHRAFGLVIAIFAVIQLLLGIFRPHVPEPGEDKTTTRKVWEVAHKGLGYFCFGLALYQVPSGIKIYSTIFGEGQYFAAVFWAVIAGIGGAVVLGLIRLRLTTPCRATKEGPQHDGIEKNIQSHGQPDFTQYAIAIADREVPSEV